MVNIGDKVNFYAYQQKKDEAGVVTGSETVLIEGGTVVGIFLNESKRLMASIMKDGERFNAHMAAVNAEPSFKEEFDTMMQDVDKLTKEGNADVTKVATQWNTMVEERESQVVGAPMEIEA